jgi:hypothetical protein
MVGVEPSRSVFGFGRGPDQVDGTTLAPLAALRCDRCRLAQAVEVWELSVADEVPRSLARSTLRLRRGTAAELEHRCWPVKGRGLRPPFGEEQGGNHVTYQVLRTNFEVF